MEEEGISEDILEETEKIEEFEETISEQQLK